MNSSNSADEKEGSALQRLLVEIRRLLPAAIISSKYLHPVSAPMSGSPQLKYSLFQVLPLAVWVLLYPSLPIQLDGMTPSVRLSEIARRDQRKVH